MKTFKHWLAGLAILLLSAATNWAVATIQLNNTYPGYPVECYNPWIDPNTIYVELLSSIDGNNWLPVHVAGGTETEFKVSENGYFDAGVGVIPNAPDDSQVFLSLRAWGGGPSFDTAGDRASTTWIQTTGSWDPDSGLPATGPALLAPSQLILNAPEPSTLALVLLGSGMVVGHSRLCGHAGKKKINS